MSSESYQVIAIIVAGGLGRRFETETPKQFLDLLGEPLLLRTLRAFQQAAMIDAICLVVPEGFQKTVEGWREDHPLEKLTWIVPGGEERQDSTSFGFKALPACDVILVHDGARPLVDTELIERVVMGAREKGACVPGLHVQETLKKVAASRRSPSACSKTEGLCGVEMFGHVLATVDREHYATIQTPQGFRYPILAEALREAETDGFRGTDEAMLVERRGFPVCVIEGSADNIKVTTPTDFEWAEALLRKRGN